LSAVPLNNLPRGSSLLNSTRFVVQAVSVAALATVFSSSISADIRAQQDRMQDSQTSQASSPFGICETPGIPAEDNLPPGAGASLASLSTAAAAQAKTRILSMLKLACTQSVQGFENAYRITFFAAIAHALRVAKHNACGLLRTLVEKGLWHVISQADEYNAMERLKRTAQAQQTQPAQPVPESLFLRTPTEESRSVEVWPLAGSKDALVVETLTADLKQAGVGGDLFALVQRHGYLQDWDRERWERAEREIAQARLFRARQRYEITGMTKTWDIIPETVHEDKPSVDWG
jgi:hypothetical protein